MNSLIKAILFQPGIGALDFDSSPQTINSKQGAYTNSLNVSSISLVTKGDRSLYEVNGNVLEITPPTIAQQNKQYVITITQTNALLLQVQFLNLNGSEFPTNTVASYTTTNVLTTDTTAFALAISNELTANGYANVVDGTVPGTIIVTITQFLGFDYNIVNDGSTAPITITTTKEAWDNTVTGMCYPTGSKDWLDDLFIMSSSVGSAPVSFDIDNIASTGSEITINVNGDVRSSIAVGDAVSVVNADAITEANGTWIVDAITFTFGQTNIVLYNSLFSNGGGNGTITVNIYGFLNISVSQLADDNETWTTYNLLQTKQINSNYNHPYRDVDGDEANDVINLYMTDNNDLMHIFSYTGAYMNNGAIEYYNPDGEYTYEGISTQMKLIIGNSRAAVSNAVVINGGGAVLTGLWRYSTVLRYADLTGTYPSLLSSPVEIYTADMNSPINVQGDVAGLPSGKQVQITVSDIPLDTFAFIDLIGVNYVGGAEVGYLIKTVAVPQGATTMQITHVGDEQSQNYDTELLDQQGVSYIKAGSLKIVTGTLMLANLTTQAVIDFTNFTKTGQHTVKKGTTQLQATGDDTTGWNVLGDYKNPVAQFSYQGGMLNETERMGCQYELLDGTLTNIYWFDDIRLDNFATNRANPFNDNRRIGSPFTNYDISSDDYVFSYNNNAYVTYLELFFPDLNFLIDGVPFNQLVSRVHWMRVDTVQYGLNEVLTCGLINRHVSGIFSGIHADDGVAGGAAGTAYQNPFLLTPVWQPATGMYEVVAVPQQPLNDFFDTTGMYTPYSYGAWNHAPGFVTIGFRTNDGSFYSPELLWGQNQIAYSSGDAIICYGQPDFRFNIYADETGCYTFGTGGHPASGLWGVFLKLSGSTNQATEPTHNVIPNSTGFQIYSEFAGLVGWNPPSGGTTQYAPLAYGAALPPTFTWAEPEHYLISCTSALTQLNATMGAPNTAGSYDIGLYYAQYYRDLGSLTASTNAANYPNNTKFGAITQGTYIPTGTYTDITASMSTLAQNVFGFDTYTQKVIFKLRYPNTNNNTGNGYDAGAGIAVAFFCQNRFNWNMRNAEGTGESYPAINPNINDYVNFDTNPPEITSYDNGYTPRNPDNQAPAFNPSLETAQHQGSKEVFTATKIQGEISNAFRQLPALNQHSEQTNYGDITALLVIDQELFVLQPRALWRDFFNETGTFKSEENESIVLGSSLPFSNNPKLITNNGCSNRFSVIQGKGLNGEDVACWIDIINCKVMMLSRNGIRDLTVENNMRSWFEDNLNSNIGDIPILNNQKIAEATSNYRNAISSVFDEKRKEFIWTVVEQCTTSLGAWDNSISYPAGSIVNSGAFTPLQGLTMQWRALITTTIGHAPGDYPSEWELATDIQSIYTIAYSLYANNKKGGFTTFYTPLPYFYAQWKNTYLSAYPTMDFNGIYLADAGTPSTWFSQAGGEVTEQGYFEFVCNEGESIIKVFEAIQVSSLFAPLSMSFTTQYEFTTLVAAKFRNVKNLWLAGIPNDTLAIPTADGWNGKCQGEYIINGVYFDIGSSQKINNFATKFKVFLPNLLT